MLHLHTLDCRGKRGVDEGGAEGSDRAGGEECREWRGGWNRDGRKM